MLRRKLIPNIENNVDIPMDALDDVLNAVRLMIRRNEGAVKMYLPISLVFQHQVYRTIQSRTKVDQSIYNLRKRGKILIIRMNGSLHDAKGIVLLDSYQQLLKRVLIDSCIATHFKDCFKVLVQHLPKMGTFSDKIYYSYFEELFGMKASDNRKRKRNEQVHDVLCVCMKMGILLPRRDLDDQEEVYQLSIPKLGKLIKAMVKARSEIMMTIKRRPFQEISERDIKPLKHSVLPLEFHLSDLVGANQLCELTVPAGRILRIPKHA